MAKLHSTFASRSQRQPVLVIPVSPDADWQTRLEDGERNAPRVQKIPRPPHLLFSGPDCFRLPSLSQHPDPPPLHVPKHTRLESTSHPHPMTLIRAHFDGVRP